MADKTTDLYPTGATSFTQVNNYQVTDIAMEDEIITFTVNGGGEEINLGVELLPAMEEGKSYKIIRNGQLLIIRDGKMYDVIGRLMSE